MIAIITNNNYSLPPYRPLEPVCQECIGESPPPPSIGVSWLMTIGIHPPLASVRSSNCFSMWPTLPLWLGPH
ncbi:hypothetical protein DSO57_1036634 [Entomophthora muscae]|uniref:Uncharacterized protein n=1 Tax=Entomophthora muscae TaxID=34485 RepID=A0ACC2RE09_9FUNG|nr:hypothetical protein DSO57_1036634 [Entomophthora muscae]